MEVTKLIEVLKATLDPSRREQAEQQLTEVHKIINFAPTLLQVVMTDQIEMAVRQAGVIYLKNMLTQYWTERTAENVTDNVPFSIHEQDRQPIRENIIEAIIQTPEPVKVQLCVCLSHIIKSDFPGRWPDVAEKMTMYLNSNNDNTWMGALLSIYQFVKVFEYKRCEERQIMDDKMVHMLPILYHHLIQSVPDLSDSSCLRQKQILKIFFAYTQNYLPLSVLTREFFSQWMEAIGQIVAKDIPPETSQLDEEDLPEHPSWKLKKWAVHILSRLFERYGSPGNVTKEYTSFSEWYLKTFSGGVLNVLLKLLERYRQKLYVAPRVLQQSLNYINQGIGHAFAWKSIKQHMQTMIEEVIFPLMCHSDEDEDLWTSDPHEYIRIKYDVFEDFLSPVMAAQTVFHSATARRKEVLSKAMGFCMKILTNPGVEPRQRDGALHMIGAVAEVLFKRKMYKEHAENLLTNQVFPCFESDYGYLRARACWVIRNFSELKFKSDDNLLMAVELVKVALCSDKDLPVRVEAAIALQMLITEQDKAKTAIQPCVKPVILELLKVIRETENDDLTGVMQKLVCTFVQEITPLAVEMMSHLAQTFAHVIASDNEGSEEKAITALGIINTMETILNVMEDQKEIIVQLEGIVLHVIDIILRSQIIDFYEEVLSLIFSLTSSQISHYMWNVFGMIYEMFKKDGIDYFLDMMPALHNYITVDTDAFLSNPTYLQAIFDMCKTVLNSDIGEDPGCHAAKLLEIILLQCPGRVDHVLEPFVELALTRLTREVQTSELRTMCLQVVIAGLYYNTPLLFDILNKMTIPNVNGSILTQFLQQWLHDADCFLGLHDRKMCVLGLCALMSLAGQRPQEVSDIAPQILPAALVHFQGLKRAYASRALEDNSDDDDSDDDDEEGDDVLSSDEDVIDDAGQQYLERLESVNRAGEDGDDDDDELTDYETEETALESYSTPLDAENCPVDEYQVFKNILTSLPNHDAGWYQILTGNLNADQTKEIGDVFKLSEQRKAVADSKKIEECGGYNFTNRQVPSTFNFGSA